jgi:hypothetical protein
MLASTFQNWNRRGGADPFASFLFAPGPESLVILKVIGYAGAARPKGRAGEPLPVLGIRVDGDSDIGERSFAVVTGDSCEAQPTIALQKQRTGGLEPSSVNGSIANPLEERFRRIRFKDCLVRRAQCREHATFCQAYSHSCLYQDFVS